MEESRVIWSVLMQQRPVVGWKNEWFEEKISIYFKGTCACLCLLAIELLDLSLACLQFRNYKITNLNETKGMFVLSECLQCPEGSIGNSTKYPSVYLSVRQCYVCCKHSPCRKNRATSCTQVVSSCSKLVQSVEGHVHSSA